MYYGSNTMTLSLVKLHSFRCSDERFLRLLNLRIAFDRIKCAPICDGITELVNFWELAGRAIGCACLMVSRGARRESTLVSRWAAACDSHASTQAPTQQQRRTPAPPPPPPACSSPPAHQRARQRSSICGGGPRRSCRRPSWAVDGRGSQERHRRFAQCAFLASRRRSPLYRVV